MFVFISAVWPLISWLNWTITQVDTDYYAIRYVCMFCYMAISNIPYSAVDNMQMLLGDNFFLVQICSMLMFNTWSLNMQVFTIVPMLIFQNGKICLDIVNYVKEPF